MIISEGRIVSVKEDWFDGEEEVTAKLSSCEYVGHDISTTGLTSLSQSRVFRRALSNRLSSLASGGIWDPGARCICFGKRCGKGSISVYWLVRE